MVQTPRAGWLKLARAAKSNLWSRIIFAVAVAIAGSAIISMPKTPLMTNMPRSATSAPAVHGQSSLSRGASRPLATVSDLVRDDAVKRALAWLGANSAWVTDEQVRITEISAPPFHEDRRAEYLRTLLSGFGLRVHVDEEGNVIGERPGSANDEVALIVAHLDTVFPASTDVNVRRDGGMLRAPGISDNGTGLATLMAMARTLNEAKIATRSTIIFAGDVGEEGEGNLRGISKLVEDYRSKLTAVIALDGAATDYVVTQALASRRTEITITGPGGHSWTDFGTSNPIGAMSRGIAQFLKTVEVSGTPRTTFNIGEIEGGGSVNSIPSRAAIKVDIRSEQEREITRVDAALRDAIKAGIQEEMAASIARGAATPGSRALEMQARVLGVRPGGELAANSPLLQSVMDADRFLGNRSRTERSSTDANIPLSLGIPAITLGGGGRAGGAHTLAEWYDPSGREMGLKRVLLTLLSTAGVETEAGTAR